LAAAPLLVSAGSQDASPSPREDPQNVKSFALPDTRAARARAASAEGHIAAQRWSEALNALQILLEDHRGDVLPGTREPLKGAAPSQQPVYPGAAERARERLLDLPREAREMYREQHENDGRLALDAAIAHGDRRALAEVARRWPLCEAAERAWWALGDIELELADTREALYAWRRALASSVGQPDLALHSAEEWQAWRERFAKSDASASSGILRRIDFALRFLAESARAGTSGAFGSVDGRAAGTASALPPGREADAWPEPFALQPNLSPPPPLVQNSDNFFPARSGDMLLVSTSLRLLALNAYSGALVWDSGEPLAWRGLSDRERDSFWKAIDRGSALIAPAAGAHVAIAALQIPLAFIENEDFQQTIPITRKIPDRRLFAFDLATGKKLWDHVPPPLWDGEAGGFVERMSVAGPPVIAGTRVIAPFYRMQGRIDYHVGCFDVDTGALLWSTSLISGQRELNMFGRPLTEFCAPPVRIVNDRVIALTQLGAVACLDLFTGEILWETTYEQIPLIPNHDFNMRSRPRYWKNSAPAITSDMVVCTPYDSADLIGLDLDSGTMRWSLPHDAINRVFGTYEGDVELLIGATDSTVYLGGDKIVALESRTGLHTQAPVVPKWPAAFEDEDMRGSRPGRAVLFGDRVLVPTLHKRIDVDARLGRAIGSLAWADRGNPGAGRGGNLWLGAGEMFTVSGSSVDGYFEWDVLVQRARRAFEEHPADPRCALDLGRLLSNRGEGEWQKGQTENARVHVDDAQSVLERGLAQASGEGAQALRSELHVVLRRAARVRADLADGAGALQALQSAEKLAASREDLRDTLLEELVLLRIHDTPERQAAWTRALDTLERSSADLSVMCEIAPGEEGAGTSRGFSTRFVPLVGSAAKSEAVPFVMPVGLWVAFERSTGFIAAGDIPRAFAELHRILELYADVELPTGSAAEIASDGIAALLDSGRRTGYETFEKRAQALFEAALQQNDKDALARVSRLFPHSRAARSASDARLTLAADAGDAALVLGIVQSELSPRFRMADADAREVHLCLRVASVMKRIGNLELADELVRSLGELRPEMLSDLAGDGGQKLGTLARGLPRWSPPESAPRPGRFGPSSRVAERYRGEQELLGFTYGAGDRQGQGNAGPPSPAPTCAVFAAAAPDSRSATITAFADAGSETLLWQSELGPGALPARFSSSYWMRRAAFAAGRVVIATHESILGLDAQDGQHAWEWRPPGVPPESISIVCAAGVVVATVQGRDGRYVLQALDAHSGIELWRDSLLDTALQPVPILSSNQALFVPVSGRKQFVVRDLFTGRRALQFESEVPSSVGMDQDAWIEGDRLVLPWFNESRSSARDQMMAIDLRSGRRLWRLAFGAEAGGERRMLTGILQHGPRTFLVVDPWPDPERPNPARAILELSTAIGATAPLSNIRIGSDDRILGWSRDSRARFSSSLVFLLSSARPGIRETRLRAVDLASGELWTQNLALALSEIQMLPTPQPAVSDTTVAIAYSLLPPQKQSRSTATTRLAFFDRSSGLPRDSLDLDRQLGQSDSLELIPLGAALLVKGQRMMEILR
jgi:outer membrane protein assembly factor BamB